MKSIKELEFILEECPYQDCDHCIDYKIRLETLKEVLGLMDEIKIDEDMPRSKETWNWIKEELKERITEGVRT